MKNIVLILFGICLSGIVCSQRPNIILTFTADYKITSEYLKLDSIRVTNVTRSVDTMLYYPDTVLVLEYSVGVRDDDRLVKNFRVFQNRPNPVTDLTVIDVFVPGSGKMNISISDETGRLLYKSAVQTRNGYHSFAFRPGGEGVFIFTANWNGNIRSIKILSGVQENQEFSVRNSGVMADPVGLKSGSAGSGFVFAPGDSLVYVGYAKTPDTIAGSDVLEDKPAIDSTYVFHILEGIGCLGIPAILYGRQAYKTLQIGTQCWFKENLNVGTRINGSQDQTDNSIIEKYCYNDLESNCDNYGGLYQWDEIMQYVTSEGAKGICPESWHIPTDAELSTLTTYLGGEPVAGGKMKEAGLAHWASPNTGATNSSGFTALPGGGRYPGGIFCSLTSAVTFWSSSQDDPTTSWSRILVNNYGGVARGSNYKVYGFSVRCILD